MLFSIMNSNTQTLRDFNENINMDDFDLDAGKSWIYPTNYPLRDYQYNIVAEALYKNTLVSLPTGLGKTFIAAVVMYNFYRWYPSGKIIFMAPTRPLVKQQIDACYNIMAIPKEKTIELTGTRTQTSRIEFWMSKRVFFITPQVLQNDLNVIPDLSKQIRCIVIDEAHKAKGNYSYCDVVNQIYETNKHFRILALSATPGSTMGDVSEIVKNLLISHIEFRTEDSPDVMPYVFQRTMETIVVPLGDKLQSVKAAYLQILERYTRILVQNKVIVGNNCANLTKGRMFMLRKEFQEKNKHTKVKAYGDIMRNLNLCITLYHGYELLTRHGLRGFLNYFEEHAEKALLRCNTDLHNIMLDVQEYLGPQPITDILPDGTVPTMSTQTKFGHPKFYKLQDILLKYFSTPNHSSSKVIIFTEYRDSVMEIFSLLIQHMPIIKPKVFLGQSSITQKQQINAIQSFRFGEYNTLISTCIGEEGLDIGEVDLIICFDISNKSPIRLVQRMGRTGRKKEGKIIILVTEGKEEEILKGCLVNKNYLSKNILKSKELHLNLYQNNPRMVPEAVTPICQKIHISVPTDTKTKRGNLKSMLNNMVSKGSPSQELSYIEVIEMQDRIPDINMIWDKRGNAAMDIDGSIDRVNFSKHLEGLRIQQQINTIGHSKNCNILTSLLQFADSKRYNIPITQTETTVKEVISKKNKFGRHDSSDNYKQSDIRTMFLRSQVATSQSTPANDADNVINLIEMDDYDHQHNELVNELHNEISTNISLSCLEDADCKICANLFTCYRPTKIDSDLKMNEWIQPSFSIIEEITLNDIVSFRKSLKPDVDILSATDMDLFEDFAMKEDWDNFDLSCRRTNDKSHLFSFEPPKSATKVLEKSNILCGDNIECNFLTENEAKVKYEGTSNVTETNADSALSFFKLDEVNNIFGTVDDGAQEDKDGLIEMEKSPSLLTFSQQEKITNGSNISTFARTKQENSVSRKLFTQDEKLLNIDNGPKQETNNSNKLIPTKPRLSNLNSARKSNFFKSKADSITPGSPECSKSESITKIPSASPSNDYVSQLFTNISDFCDLSIFGLESAKPHEKEDSLKETANGADASNCGSEDLFDSSPNSPQSEMNTSINVDSIFDLNKLGISNQGENLSDKTLAKNRNDQDEETSPLLISNVHRNALEIFKTKRKESNDNDTLSKNNDSQDEDSLSPLLTGVNKRNLHKYSKVMNSREESESNNSIGNNKNKAELQKVPDLTTHDICDLSFFGMETNFTFESSNDNQVNCQSKQEVKSPSLLQDNKPKSQKVLDLTTHDICDLTICEIETKVAFESSNNPKANCSNLTKREPNSPSFHQNNKPKSPEVLDLSDDICDLTGCEMEAKDFVFESSNAAKANCCNQTTREVNSPNLLQGNKSKSKEVFDLTADDIFDSSIFGVTEADFAFKSPNDRNTNTQNQTKPGTSYSSQNNETYNADVSQLSVTQIVSLINKYTKPNTNDDNKPQRSKLSMSTPEGKRKTPVKKLYPDNANRNNYNHSPTLVMNPCFRESRGSSSRTPLKEDQTSARKKYNFAKRKRPLSQPKCDSEDEFEDSLGKNSGWIQFKKEGPCNALKTTQKSPQNTILKKKKKKSTNPFIDNEAALDSCDEVEFRDSHSEGGSSDDDFETSFVNDRTVLHTVDIHGKYLQTTRSPVRNKGVFKIPKQLPLRKNIFSQAENYADDTYLNDTFCVDDDDENLMLSQKKSDLSELEVAELILEGKKKRKTKKKFNKAKTKVIIMSSDSE